MSEALNAFAARPGALGGETLLDAASQEVAQDLQRSTGPSVCNGLG